MRARTRGHVRGGRCVLASNEGHRGNFESASMGGSVGLSGAVWGGPELGPRRSAASAATVSGLGPRGVGTGRRSKLPVIHSGSAAIGEDWAPSLYHHSMAPA